MKKILYVTAFLFMLGISGCDVFLGPDTPIGKGSLVIGFGEDGARSVLTEETLAALRYELVLTGPDGETTSASLSAGETFNRQVSLGEWRIDAKAFSPAGSPVTSLGGSPVSSLGDSPVSSPGGSPRPIGEGTATVTVRAGTNQARIPMRVINGGGLVYRITLDVPETYVFPAAAVGYGDQTAKEVTVTNMGNQATGALTLALTGTDSGSFTLDKTSIDSIAPDRTGAFTVVPRTGLAEGAYSAGVTVSGDNGISASFTVNFTVNPVYTITAGSYTGGTVEADTSSAAAGTTVTLTVTPDTGYALKAGTLTYNGTAVTGGPPYTFTMPAANVTAGAVFIRQFSIAIEGPAERMPAVNGVNSNDNKTSSTEISYSAKEYLTFTVEGAAYSVEDGGLKWYVDGTAITGVTGNSLVVQAADYIKRTHTLTVMIKKDGLWYSGESQFTVIE